MTCDVDCVVVGGGIAGLTTALRLASHGCRVSIVEQHEIGAGATTTNHGMLHSGALFAQLHPEIVPSCGEAQEAFWASCSQSVTPRWGWYVASPDQLDHYQKRWNALGIAHQPVPTQDLRELMHPSLHERPVRAAAVREYLVDTHALLTDLLGRCQVVGVTVLPARAERVRTEHGQVRGLDLDRDTVSARQVVLCCGLGTRTLLATVGSRLGPRVRSRLSLLAAYPNGALTGPMFGLEFGGPAVVPTTDGDYVLASWHGGDQPRVQQIGRWPVPLGLTHQLRNELAHWFPATVLDWQEGCAWVCSKTEYSSPRGDQWGVDPNYAVLDHHALEQVRGLWTVLPAKMTLALHASRELTRRLLRVTEPVSLPEPPPSALQERPLVASRPWTLY